MRLLIKQEGFKALQQGGVFRSQPTLPALMREESMWCRPGALAAKGWYEGYMMCARAHCVKISAIVPKSTDLFVTDIAKRGESGYNSIGVA